LTTVDVMVFAGYCQSFHRWRVCEELLARRELVVRGRGGPRVNPLVRISRAAAQLMLHCATQFGMTPAARSRIAGGIGGKPSRRPRNSTG
jgi:P27 family predicted phage terminase small subunit